MPTAVSNPGSHRYRAAGPRRRAIEPRINNATQLQRDHFFSHGYPFHSCRLVADSSQAVGVGGRIGLSLAGSLDQPLVAVPVRIDVPIHLSGDPARVCRSGVRRPANVLSGVRVPVSTGPYRPEGTSTATRGCEDVVKLEDIWEGGTGAKRRTRPSSNPAATPTANRR